MSETPKLEAVVEARWRVHTLRTSYHGTLHSLDVEPKLAASRREGRGSTPPREHARTSPNLSPPPCRVFVAFLRRTTRETGALVKREISTMSFPLHE